MCSGRGRQRSGAGRRRGCEVHVGARMCCAGCGRAFTQRHWRRVRCRGAVLGDPRFSAVPAGHPHDFNSSYPIVIYLSFKCI